MKLTEFMIDIGHPVAFYPSLRKLTKSTTANLFLCQFIYWTGKQADPEGWIYKTSEEIEEETGLSYDEQATARRRLVELGFIEEKYKRLDHKMVFRVIANAINEEWGKLQHGFPETGNTAFGKPASPVSLISNAENTTENTTENGAAFSNLQNVIKKLTGIAPSGTADTKAIDDLVASHATEEDIKAAYTWFIGTGRVFQHYASLVGPTKTAISKRSAAKNSRSEPHYAETY